MSQKSLLDQRDDLTIEKERSLYWRGIANQLKRENAALRADKERLDWLDHKAIPWNWLSPELIDGLGPIVVTWTSNCTLRAAIDAARKEAQP